MGNLKKGNTLVDLLHNINYSQANVQQLKRKEIFPIQ